MEVFKLVNFKYEHNTNMPIVRSIEGSECEAVLCALFRSWHVTTLEEFFKKEEQEFVARKLDAKGWTKYLSLSVLWWLVFGLIYQSVGANRPYRDSITDATNGVGQILMTAVYREQWIFWAATNIFSIYLWWGASLQIQGKYLIYLINSLVGWYQWNKAAKKA